MPMSPGSDEKSVKVSLLLLSFRAETTIERALEHAFAQDWPNLEIIVSDDCSDDATAAIARRVIACYTGPHRVVFRRNVVNGGIVANINAAAGVCTGDLIVFAAADDYSHPERVARIADAWTRNGCPDTALIYSDVTPITPEGTRVRNWSETIARPPWSLERFAGGASGPLGASCAITPSLLRQPGQISSDVRHEDRVLPFRALLLGGTIIFIDAPLVDYCVNGGVSRHRPTSRWDSLTRIWGLIDRATLPDAYQRLSDARAVGASPGLVSRLEGAAAFQQVRLAMSDGKSVLRKAAAGIAAGAPLMPTLAHLARLARARLSPR